MRASLIPIVFASPQIQLSGAAVAEDAANGTTIGTLSVARGRGTYTFTVQSDPDGLFDITGGALDKDGTLDFEAASSHQVQIKADNGAGSVLYRWFTIGVTNVAPVLSNATDTKTGQTTADITVDTTETAGTVYAVGSTLLPTAAQIKAGLDSTGAVAAYSATQAVASSGTKTIGLTGLTADTAYPPVRWMHEEPDGTQSNVASGNGFTTDGAGITGLLDVLAVSAIRAYSFRKLRNDYMGSACRVRRGSDDSEMDIGFLGEDFDAPTLLTFAGAGDAFLKTRYDQSGSGDDAVQATAAAQTRIVSAGVLDIKNSLPAEFYDGTNDKLQSTTSFTFQELGAVVAVNDAASPFDDWHTPVTAPNVIGLTGEAGAAHWFTGGAMDTVNVNNTGSANAVFNGVLQQVHAYRATGQTWNNVLFGQERSNNYFAGWVCEVVLFDAALSAGNRTALKSNQKTYWGTP